MVRIPEKIIDFHVHLFPDKLFDAIWDSFAKIYNWNIIHRYYYKECIARLRQSGVGTIVYSNYAHRAGIAEGLNRWNIKILEEYEGLYCFAAYHPDDDNALEMAQRLLENPKILGFKLHHLVQNFYPCDVRLFPLYEMVIRKNKHILFHTGTGPVGNKYVGLGTFHEGGKKIPGTPRHCCPSWGRMNMPVSSGSWTGVRDCILTPPSVLCRRRTRDIIWALIILKNINQEFYTGRIIRT